jgi:hypothetical protein
VSFNLGIASHPTSRIGALSSVGVYLYEDVYYRQWISEIALAFYEGRQDEFVYLDLVRQFRNPEKQQIIPINLTREIIDEISILYQEEPVYQVVDEKGNVVEKDQKLWDEIRQKARYNQIMDKVDRWCNLLGTVLIKVSFIDPNTGLLVGENSPGQIQLDVMHGGVYDVKSGASPYYITELLIGFSKNFAGFAHERGATSAAGPLGLNIARAIPDPGSMGVSDARYTKRGSIAYKAAKDIKQLGKINRIYWSPTSHLQVDADDNGYESDNPYGIVPAVPFFNSDPAHYYFLPINEPLIYANHATNMRLTDLNHIAKFQSFGVPVLKGVERMTSTRHGRPVDDLNQLKGGGATSRFGGIGNFGAFGAGGQFRTFDAGLGGFQDGNAEANKLGLSLGPDTAVAVGEKGDFKFAHPSADITGLVRTIHSMTDMVRINHGLRPKYEQQLPSSGFAILMEKIGVIGNNVRRSRLFKEREQQLFETIKKLWNTHHQESGQRRFSESSRLEITYKIPEFPVDPKTKVEQIMMETKLMESGDTAAIKKILPHLTDAEVKAKLKEWKNDYQKQQLFKAKVEVEKAKLFQEAGIESSSFVNSVGSGGVKSTTTGSTKVGSDSAAKEAGVAEPKMDNKVKHSEESSKQPARNGDQRAKE